MLRVGNRAQESKTLPSEYREDEDREWNTRSESPWPRARIGRSDSLTDPRRRSCQGRGATTGIEALAAVLIAVLVGCGGGDRDPRCIAKEALRDAVRAVGEAEVAEGARDEAGVRQHIGDVERLVGVARRNLSSSSPVDRSMLEAAGYLDFIVGDFRASGAVDGALAQFASRELNRGLFPGEAPLNC